MSERPSAAVRASSPPDPLLGRTINGRFSIVSLIARGGMGKVYRAEQTPLGRVCALKILNPNYSGDGDGEFQKRFFLEASIVSKLKHPNTITVFDYGKTDDDVFYMAMELLEGKTLHKAIRQSGSLPEERAMHIARQVCRSLREAHMMGVIHRDLKPANIFLTEHGDEADFVKVLDFGLVKNLAEKPEEQLTHTGLFMGSPKYMAPEQIQGTAVDGRTDIYALGVMLFEMLTGKVPFERATSVNTLMAHVSEAPPRLRDVKADIILSPALEELVYKCIAKDANQRFNSMDEVLVALKHASGINMAAATGDFHSFQAIQAAARLSASGSNPVPAMRSSGNPIVGVGGANGTGSNSYPPIPLMRSSSPPQGPASSPPSSLAPSSPASSPASSPPSSPPGAHVSQAPFGAAPASYASQSAHPSATYSATHSAVHPSAHPSAHQAAHPAHLASPSSPPPPGGASASQSGTPMPLVGAHLSAALVEGRRARSPFLLPVIALAAIVFGGSFGFGVYRASAARGAGAAKNTANAGSPSTPSSADAPLTRVDSTGSANPGAASAPANADSASNGANSNPSPSNPSTSDNAGNGVTKWMVTTDPEGASVRENGVEVCNATPCELSMSGADLTRAHHLVFLRGGYRTETRTAKVADGSIFAHLLKVGGGGGGRPARDPGKNSGAATGTSNGSSPGASPGTTTPATSPSGFKDTPY